MTIKVMTRIWDHAPHKGSQLLLLLAMADVATEESICWPGTAYLAKQIRMSVRQTQRMLDALIADGSIACIPGVGRGRFDHYAILVGLSAADQDRAREQLEKRVNMSPFPDKTPYTKDDKMTPIRQRKGRQDDTHSPEERVTFLHEKGDISLQERVTFSHAPDTPFTRMPLPQTDDQRRGDPDHDPMIHDGDDDGGGGRSAPLVESDLVSFLLGEGMGAAAEFADIPTAVGKADFMARRAARQSINTIVRAWRAIRPTAEAHYGLRGDQTGDGRDGPRRGDGAPDRRTAGQGDDRRRSVGAAGRGGGPTAVEEAQGAQGGAGPAPASLDFAALEAEARAELAAARARRC